jgi:hypothetical protein
VLCVYPGYVGRIGYGSPTSPYRVWDNSWQMKTCIRVTGPHSFTVLNCVPYRPGGVGAYPSIEYGSRWGVKTPGSYLPMLVSKAKRLPLWVTVNAGPPFRGCKSRWQGDFDGYFYPTVSTMAHGTGEIVVVTQDGQGALPRHRSANSTWAPVRGSLPSTMAPLGTVHTGTGLTCGGQWFSFSWWMTDGGDPTVKPWPLYFFHIAQDRVHVVLPMGRFATYLAGHHILKADEVWWGGYGYGYENWFGGGGEAGTMYVMPT